MPNMEFEKLGNIISISKGKKHNIVETISNQTKRYIQINDLRNDLNIQYTDDEKGILVDKNDLIIAWDGANAGTVGYNLDGLIGSTLARLKINDLENYNTQYLAFFLQSKFAYLRSKTTGATIPHLHRKTLENLKIPILEIEEQKKIANLLSQIETLILKREKTIELLDKLVKSTFLEMFGDPVLNPKNWETKTIEQIVKEEKYSIKRGPFGGALKKEIFVDDGYLVYEQFHALNNDFSMARYFIDEEKFNELKAFEVVAGDIIISCSGVYLGKLAVIPEGAKKGIINQALLKVSLDNNKMNHVLFINIFTNENFRNKFFANNRGAGVPNFPPMTDFKKFQFISPPKDLQNKFEEIAQKIETTKEKYQKSLDELNQLFGSVSQKAFKGELDLGVGTLYFEDKFPDILDEIVKEEKRKNTHFEKAYKKYTTPFTTKTEDGEAHGHQMNAEGFKNLIKEILQDSHSFEELQTKMFSKNWIIPYDEDQNKKEKPFTFKDTIFQLLKEGEIVQDIREYKQNDKDQRKIVLKALK